MLRTVWFLVKLSLAVAGIVWLARHPGTVEFTFGGWLVETSAGFATAALLAFLFLYTMAHNVWRATVTAPRAFRRHRAARLREKGYRDVTAGLVAVAAGDARAAEKYALRAEARIPGAPLAKLLSAQSHLLNGDAGAARRAFTALLDDGQGAFFGLRGLLQETLQAGNYREALQYIRKADGLQPKRAWVARTLFDLETRNREWARALPVLKKAEKLGVFTGAEAQRRRQALFLAEAEDAYTAGDFAQARRLAQKSFAPDAAFTPAALRLAPLLEREGRAKAALKTLERAWAASPHPALAALWLRRVPEAKKSILKKPPSPYDAGKNILLWAQRLHDINPGHRKSLRLMGHAALAARQWREARVFLTQAEDFQTLARLELEETGDEAQARAWQEAAAARPEPTWTCAACNHAAPDWTPLCPHCGAFCLQSWRVPAADMPKPVPDILPPAVNDLASYPEVVSYPKLLRR